MKYFIPKCTYINLLKADGTPFYTICRNHCETMGIAPLESEEYKPLSDEMNFYVRKSVSYLRGHIGKEDFLQILGNARKFAEVGEIKAYVDGNWWTPEEAIKQAMVRVRLTPGGKQLVGNNASRIAADKFNKQAMYVLAPFLQDVTVTDGEEEGGEETVPVEPEEKEDGKKKLINKILLALLGWVILN